MRNRIASACALIVLAATSAPAEARKLPDGPPPAQINSLLACRAITDQVQRLACFDRTVADIGTAVSNNDLVVFDREAVKRTKRGLFGFGIPNLGIFGDGDDSVEVKQIEGTVAGLSHNADGGWVVRLEDGSRWSQVDGKPVFFDPSVGDKVVVKRGALAAYFMSVAGRPGFKVKRIS